jgi:tRNA(adenine34) deaminase
MNNQLSPMLRDLDLERWMRLALAEAETAGRAGEIPIGAVIVVDGELISRGRAQQKALRNRIRHAELNALLDGGERLWTDYQRALLFSTVEPCPLCLGAAVMADVPHIIFALRDFNVHSDVTLEHNPYIRRHIQSYFGGVLEAEARAIVARYQPQVLEYIERGGRTCAS